MALVILLRKCPEHITIVRRHFLATRTVAEKEIAVTVIGICLIPRQTIILSPWAFGVDTTRNSASKSLSFLI